MVAPWFLITTYLPGLALGLSLCAVHGHYEHVRGTTSNYGRIYNWVFLNDGHHVEHHVNPGASWRRLPQLRRKGATTSRYPAVFRWLESGPLGLLERLVLSSKGLQRFVLASHERAFRRLLPRLPRPSNRRLLSRSRVQPRRNLGNGRMAPAHRFPARTGR